MSEPRKFVRITVLPSGGDEYLTQFDVQGIGLPAIQRELEERRGDGVVLLGQAGTKLLTINMANVAAVQFEEREVDDDDDLSGDDWDGI